MHFHSPNEDSFFHQRLLADAGDGKEDEAIDYSVLSIGVQTLGLILFVEIIKHRLDHAAKGRPFFGTVLHSVYSELSTLGIVELFVYLILKYYKDYDKAQKGVFADVHFALFYTAVFNAFQSVIVAMATIRTSNSLWVETEHLELDHYVEIREEFDRVREKFGYEIDDELASGPSLRNLPRYLLQSIRNPGLRGRYMNLLVQVNFHSLRLHFLQANKLPLTLKVSDYLKRSEERVLEKLVHVSGGAWLMLTGGLNLIYFLMGMVAYVFEDPAVVGLFLTCIFFCMMVVFIFICVALYFKMRKTFRAIITLKYELNMMDEEAREAGLRHQLDLFWFREPQFVISIIQFMQFGYALALAIVLMYWTSLTILEPYWFLAAVLVCYGIFVYVLSMALPQYTLCTSLGYLVDQRNLMETVAVHRLEDARRLQLRQRADLDFDDCSMISFETNDQGTHQTKDSVSSGDSGRISSSGLLVDNSSRDTEKTKILAELVKSDTSSLRNLLPESSRESLRSREQRRDRRKSVSDGVALMRALGSAIGDVAGPTLLNRNLPHSKSQIISRSVDDSDILKRDRAERAARRRARKKTVSASEVIQSWQHVTTLEKKKFDNSPASNGARGHDIPISRMQQRAERIAQRRQNRSKSKSESAVIRTWHDSATIAVSDDKVIKNAKLLAETNDHESIPLTRQMQPSPSDAAQKNDLERHESTDTVDPGYLHKYTKNDDSTLKMDESIGVLSDVDVREWEANDLPQLRWDSNKSCSASGMVNYARDYFSGHPYHTISHVFGSLIVFFLVGHRVEVMLSTTGVIDPSENTWEFHLNIIFWIESVWYAFFVIAGSLILLLFLPIQEKSTHQRVVITAALLDILLSGACLAILFLAEAQRCCDAEELESEENCCPFWGSRTHGGLGDIEPFTSLIGLRVFRFVAGRYLVEYFDNQSELGLEADGNKKDAPDMYPHHGSTFDDSLQTEVGTPLALWERAISKYPAIVEKYGEFSSELFQSMIGLEVIDDLPQAKHRHESLPSNRIDTLSSPSKATHGTEMGHKQSLKLSGWQYANLPAEAQSIIIAGKLGKPVKSMTNLREHSTDLPALVEEPDHDSFESQQPVIVPTTTKFEIDNVKLALEENSQSNFIAPNARLERSMRRCDRRMLPILTDWGCVDIVITQFEMVYFEALDLTTPSSPSRQSYLLALQATNGGKGLRLQDVAAGRKIVGHINLSDVTEIHVSRSLPLLDSVVTNSYSESGKVGIELPVEFWSQSKSGCKTQRARQERWATVKEDRLRVVSLHGCLILRFHSDLDNLEIQTDKPTKAKEAEQEGPLRKNIALQWAQTIVHSVGRERLHQSLPHFGEDNSDELRDLLEISNFHEKEHEERVKSSKSFGRSIPLSSSTESFIKLSRPKPTFSRSQSLSSDDSLKRRIRRRLSLSTPGELSKESTPVRDGVYATTTNPGVITEQQKKVVTWS